ncbi:MAG: hypothetical protein AB1726_17715, partial [Planctomycetota bacterium]
MIPDDPDLARGKELAALRLYGELTPSEEAELDRLLAAHPAARAFASELAAGLGAARRAVEMADLAALPPDWRERLSAATRVRRGPGALVRAAATFAAGLAAGLLLAWA